MASKKPDCIGNYRFLEFLGEGGSGKVFRARHADGSRDVAIKIREFRNVNLKCLSREIKVHRQLHHEAIVKFYDVLNDVRCVYQVMELCTGMNLDEYLIKKSNRLQEGEVRHLLKPVVKGLIYLHENFIIHQDINLTNLVLTEGMQTKIVDFDLSWKMEAPELKFYNFVGDLKISSPEMMLSEGFSLPTDIWSLGCCLYQLLVGKPPFQSPQESVDIKYEMPDQLSPQAQNLIMAIFKRNPKDRPMAKDILNHPFFKDELMQTSEEKINGYDQIAEPVTGNTQHRKSANHSDHGSGDVGGQSGVKRRYGASTSIITQHESSEIEEEDDRRSSDNYGGTSQLTYIRDQCLTKPEQFNTLTMKPSRYQYADDIVATILEDGQLCVEFLKHMNGVDQVDRVVVFSPDGNVIHDVPLPTGKCYPAEAVTPDLSTLCLDIDHKEYKYNELPKHLWRLYSASALHVYELRAIMPRVICFSDIAKAELMSNMPYPDFLLQFHDGTRIFQKLSLVTITKPGHYKFSVSSLTCLPPDTVKKVQHAITLIHACVTAQKKYESLDRNIFPITVIWFPGKEGNDSDLSTSCLPTPKTMVRSASSQNLIL